MSRRICEILRKVTKANKWEISRLWNHKVQYQYFQYYSLDVILFGRNVEIWRSAYFLFFCRLVARITSTFPKKGWIFGLGGGGGSATPSLPRPPPPRTPMTLLKVGYVKFTFSVAMLHIAWKIAFNPLIKFKLKKG